MDLFRSEARRDPYPAWEAARAAGPVVHDPRTGLWIVLDHAGVKRALTDTGAFSSRASPTGGQPLEWMIFMDPPRHTQLRAIVMRAFTPRVVAGLEGRITQLVRELLEPALARGTFDVAADFAVPLPLLVIAEMIGIPLADRPRFKRWSDVILGLSDTIAGGGDAAARAAAAFRDATAEMRAYVGALTAERRRAPRDDLLTRLIEAEVDGVRLGDDDILGFFQLLLVAGSETTTNLIGNAVVSFLDHPDALATIRATPELLPSAIEEVLRFRSPIQAMFRQTRRDVAIAGAVVPAGRLVLAAIGAANRDPAHFPEPARFDVARDPNPHVSFGHGIHFCLGAALARLEARIALGEFLARVRAFEPVDEPAWEPRQAFHVHGPTRLRLRIEPSDQPKTGS